MEASSTDADAGQARRLWAGLDTGGEQSRLTIIDEQLKTVLDEYVTSETAAVAELLRRPHGRVEHVAAEASATANHLARGLRAAGVNLTLYDTAQASRFLRARRNKTDFNDARGLAELAKLRLPSIAEVHLKSPEIQALRAKVVLRHQLNRQRVACEAMMRGHLTLQLGRLAPFKSNGAMDRAVRAGLAALSETQGIDMHREILPLLDICLQLRKLVDRLEYELEIEAKVHPVCSRLMEVPGVGPICAVSFYTAVEDPHRFGKAEAVGPYLGLTPRVLQSGTTLRHGHISRMGNAMTRAHLCTSAVKMMGAGMPEQPLRTWGLQLAEKRGKGKAKVAVARRLAIILLVMWKTGKGWEPALATARESR